MKKAIHPMIPSSVMRRSAFVLLSLLSWHVGAAAAGSCATLQNQINTAQTNVRNADIKTAMDAFNNVGQTASQLKKACMDNIASTDVSSYGLGSVGTRLLMNAAQQVCDSAAQQANSALLQGNNAVNNQINSVIPQPVQQVVTAQPTTLGGQTQSGSILQSITKFLSGN
jgi:hypothetical protein